MVAEEPSAWDFEPRPERRGMGPLTVVIVTDVDGQSLEQFFQPFAGWRFLADEKVQPDSQKPVDWDRVMLAAARTVQAAGKSRDRKKAGAEAAALVLGVAAVWWPLPPAAMEAVAVALQLESYAARTTAGRASTHYAAAYLGGGEANTDAPSVAEMVCLKIVSFMRAHPVGYGKPAPLGARRAIFDVLSWQVWRGEPPLALAVNTLCMVLGVINADRELDPGAAAYLLGHDFQRLLDHAGFDAEKKAENWRLDHASFEAIATAEKKGMRYKFREHAVQFESPGDVEDRRRQLLRMRGGESYDRAESVFLRKFTALQRLAEGRVAERATFKSSFAVEQMRKFNEREKALHGAPSARDLYWRQVAALSISEYWRQVAALTQEPPDPTALTLDEYRRQVAALTRPSGRS